MGGDRLGVHLGAEARQARREVPAALDDDRVDEVLVQVVDVLDHAAVQRTADADVVEHGQVLHQLAQADAAGVRADRDAELGREQQDRQVLVDAADPGRVDLQERDGPGLQELLEDDPVLHVFAGGHADGADAPGDGGVAEHVVGAGRLLDPVRVVRGERADPLDGGVDVPALVGVDRDGEVGAAHLAGGGEAADVVLEVGADLELDLGEALVEGLLAQAAQLVVVVAEPAGRGGVGRVAVGPQVGDALRLALLALAQELQRLVAGEGVAEVAEVDHLDELLGVISASSSQSGLPYLLALRSHRALATAEIAMCMTPFSGPSQRSCESLIIAW